uniref:Uncharacterized protein n=1 Tax=Prolemur simus TaxID=1328070 RepID=A0A8C8Y8C1_PROSS
MAKSCVAEARAPGSPSLLKEEDPEPLSQQHSLHLSHRAPVPSEYLPFFRTHGQLAEEELSLKPEVCRGEAGGRSFRFTPFPEDSALPSGFFPYYCSEETFPSLVLPAWSCGGSQCPPPGREAQAGCFCGTTARDGRSAALARPDLVSESSHSPACQPVPPVSAGQRQDSIPAAPPSGGRALWASGFIPYYRSPEEGPHAGPGPPASPPRGQRPPGGLPGPLRPHREGAGAGCSGSLRRTGPRHPPPSEGRR